MPGYMPESSPVAFETRKAALDYIVDELRRAADHLADLPPEDEEQDWAGEYEQAAEDLEMGFHGDTDGSDWYDTFEDGRIAYWIEAQDVTDDEAAEMLNSEGY